ncbi:hypothetical protein HMPREF1212_02764, partial [Parabacteroides sp. HGS0025]
FNCTLVVFKELRTNVPFSTLIWFNCTLVVFKVEKYLNTIDESMQGLIVP